jgi:hypothetical protein
MTLTDQVPDEVAGAKLAARAWRGAERGMDRAGAKR